MKKVIDIPKKSLYALFIFLTFIFCSCNGGHPTYNPPYEVVDKWIDSTCVIASGGAYIWKKGRMLDANNVEWTSGDTLDVEITRESGPAIGNILLNEGYNGTYTTIFEKNDIDSVKWIHKFKNYTNIYDTVTLTINNTSASETLKVNIKMEASRWYGGYYDNP